MANPSFFRDKAEQALRLARQNTDPVLVKNLTEMAQEYMAQAAAIDGTLLSEDQENKE